ncbi:GPW/gp25 family protein [Pseudomonas lactis]|uniref:GPW/gp25 family protein n=1 Tax=Pseudomonas lactis TaxID=1615674 RepID=UPI003F7EC602
MNCDTGSAISTVEHIGQSISDILTTRLGTRVMRREYGNLLPELVDQPFNDATRLRVYAASVMAIMRWEPRVSLTRIQLQDASLQDQVVMDIEGRALYLNQALSMNLPLQLGGGA